LAVGVGVAGFQVMRDGVDDRLRDLRSTGSVKEGRWVTINHALE
jgi:hypothetical protein